MNVDSIQLYSSGSEVKPKHRNYSDAHGLMRESVEKCGKEKVNRGYYSGSFTGNNVAAANVLKVGDGFVDKVFRSGIFKSLLRVFEDKSVVASSLVALFVAGMLRPITNLAMANDKDRDDSIYAASHAIASAVIGFVVSSIVMHPFDKAFRNIKDDPKKYLSGHGLEKLFEVEEIGARKLEKSKVYKKLSKTAQFIPDSLVMGVPKAMLTIALIPVILKHVFHMEKGKKKDNNAAEQVKVENVKQENSHYVKSVVKSNPAFKSVEGGKQ